MRLIQDKFSGSGIGKLHRPPLIMEWEERGTATFPLRVSYDSHTSKLPHTWQQLDWAPPNLGLSWWMLGGLIYSYWPSECAYDVNRTSNICLNNYWKYFGDTVLLLDQNDLKIYCDRLILRFTLSKLISYVSRLLIARRSFLNESSSVWRSIYKSMVVRSEAVSMIAQVQQTIERLLLESFFFTTHVNKA